MIQGRHRVIPVTEVTMSEKRAKHPIRIVRDATGMTQEKFGEALGISRGQVTYLERRQRPFTSGIQRKVAILTGAWIEEKDDPYNPGDPVPIDSWSGGGSGDIAPWFHGEPKVYSSEDWTRWRGDWKEKRSGEPALRFDGDNEPLAFWLVLLIASGERANAAHAVRAEILHALERVRAEYHLAPHLSAILRNYKPLVPEAVSWPFKEISKAEWNPVHRPPRWLQEAIEMEPLRLHVAPPGTKEGTFILELKRIVREGKEAFLKLLAENPARAIKWARENRPSGGWLASLAERVTERKFRDLLDVDERIAVKWARTHLPDGDWQRILKSWREEKDLAECRRSEAKNE